MESLSHIENDFDLILRLAVKSFLRREMRGEVVSYKLFNPSISDFVIGEYSNNISKLSGVYSSLLTIDSVYHLESMWREKIISDSCYFEIRNLTYSCSLFDGVDANFMINNFGHMLFKAGGDKKREEMFPFIVEFINNPVYINEFECFIDICDELFSGVQINDWSFISKLISNRFLTFSEVKILVDFIEKFHIEDDGVNYSLKESIEDYIYDEINDRKSDIDLSKYIKGEFEDIYVDEISVKSELEDIEISIISEIEWELSEGLIEGLDLDSVHISIDIDEMLQEYIYSESPTTRSRSRPYQGGGYDKIDDLFDRS
jgi:hypothetical protein